MPLYSAMFTQLIGLQQSIDYPEEKMVSYTEDTLFVAFHAFSNQLPERQWSRGRTNYHYKLICIKNYYYSKKIKKDLVN